MMTVCDVVEDTFTLYLGSSVCSNHTHTIYIETNPPTPCRENNNGAASGGARALPLPTPWVVVFKGNRYR